MPSVVAETNFGMPSADGAIVEDDFERTEPSGSEQGRGLPGVAFELATDSAQANSAFHTRLPVIDGGYTDVRHSDKLANSNTYTDCAGQSAKFPAEFL